MSTNEIKQQSPSPLTPFPEGSVKELWTIAFPLMIAALSTGLMLFFDRLFLANYTTDALNASVNAGTLATTFLWGCFVFANIAEVFVAQHNGALNFKKLAEPVWQMLWFSLFSIVIFWPIGLWLGPLIYKDTSTGDLSITYFKWLMLLGPIVPMLGALSGFFVGQGKAKLVTISALIANVINITLDYLMIFGVPGLIPEMGIFGAAMATGIAQGVQLLFLGYFFLKKQNRELFGTASWQFVPSVFRRCFKVATPHALSQTIEMFAWAFFFYLMSELSYVHITVMGICQSIFVLFNFFVDGISKGASTIAGNMIGAGNISKVWKVWSSGLKLYSLFFMIVAVLLILFPDPIVDQFLAKADAASWALNANDLSSDAILSLKATVQISFLWMLVYLFFEGVRFLIVGILTAAGDTLFLLISGSLSIWVLALAPIYYFVVVLEGSIITASIITAIYSLVTCAIYYFRLKGEKWQNIKLIS